MDQHDFPDSLPRPVAPGIAGGAPLETVPEPALFPTPPPGEPAATPTPARDFVTRSLNLIDTQRTGRLVATIEEKADQFAPGPVVLTYVAVIGIAELLAAWGAVVPGAIYHAALIPILLTHYVLAEQSRYRRILPVLALFPLLRILSLTMPIKQVPYIFWYALVGIPLLVGVAFTIRLLGLSGHAVGLSAPSWPRQLFIAAVGLPLSALAFVLVHPSPATAGSGWQDFVVGASILLVATGFVEELLFRGLLQPVAVSMLGRAGMFCAAGLFTIMYLGAVSWGYTLFMGLVGWLFGCCVQRTNSIVGVTIAHGLLNIGLLLVWPRLAVSPDLEPLLGGISLGLLALWLLVALPLQVVTSRAPASAPDVGVARAAGQGPLFMAPQLGTAPAVRRRPILAGALGAIAILLLFLVGFDVVGIHPPPLPSLGNALPGLPTPAIATPQPATSATVPSAGSSSTVPPPSPGLASQVQVITLPQTSFTGGFTNTDGLYRSQPARLVFGQDTAFGQVQATFVADAPVGQAIRQARLLLHGVDSEDDAKTPIRIILNRTSIYEGPDPLPNDFTTQTGPRNWGLFSWDIPPGVVHAGTNTLTITNLDASPAPRFLVFDYGLIAWQGGS